MSIDQLTLESMGIKKYSKIHRNNDIFLHVGTKQLEVLTDEGGSFFLSLEEIFLIEEAKKMIWSMSSDEEIIEELMDFNSTLYIDSNGFWNFPRGEYRLVLTDSVVNFICDKYESFLKGEV